MRLNSRFFLKVLAGILFCIVAFFLYAKFGDKLGNQKGADSLNKLSGSLIYALSPEPDRVTDMYRYDFETGEETKIFQETEYVKFNPVYSPDKRYVAYSAAPVDFSSKLLFPHTEHLQIYIYDTENGNIEKISDANNGTFRNKMPEWSPDGKKILYHGYKASAWQKNLPIQEPNNWTIHLYDRETKRTIEVAEGTENLWTAMDDTFFYLKNDGLHIKNLKTGKDTHLIGLYSSTGKKTTPQASISMTLGISDDGKKLAWASPLSHEIVFYQVSYQPEISLKELYRLKVGEAEIYNPIFSPDGKFLAVQETEYPIERFQTKPDSSDQLSLPQLNLSKPRITVYELETFQAKKIRDLQGFDFFGTSLTQWVK